MKSARVVAVVMSVERYVQRGVSRAQGSGQGTEGEERREEARGRERAVWRVGVGGGRWKRESWRSEWERRARVARMVSRAKGSMGWVTGTGGGEIGEGFMVGIRCLGVAFESGDGTMGTCGCGRGACVLLYVVVGLPGSGRRQVTCDRL